MIRSLHAFMHRLPITFSPGKNERNKEGMKPSHTQWWWWYQQQSPSYQRHRRRHRHLTGYRTWVHAVFNLKSARIRTVQAHYVRCVSSVRCGAWCVYNVSSTASLLCNPSSPLLSIPLLCEPYFLNRDLLFFSLSLLLLPYPLCVCLLSLIVCCVRSRRQLIHSFSCNLHSIRWWYVYSLNLSIK
jgi:hypothetical protein